MMDGAETKASTGQGLLLAVGDRLDSLKSFKVRIWAPFLLGLIMLGDSFDISSIGYVMPSLRHEFALSPVQVGSIISAGYAGQLLGALALGPLAERLGRMPVFCAAIAAMSVLAVACAAASTPNLLTAFRFAQGVALGGALPVCAAYINELAPTATRGRYFLQFQFLLVSGFSLASIVGAFIIPAFGWRAMFLVGAFPVLLIPLVLATLPESPRWLARLGRKEATNKALIKLGAEPVDANLDATVQKEAPRIPVAKLFSQEVRSRTLTLSALWFFSALVSYAFSTWTTTLYVDEFHFKHEDALRYVAISGVVHLFSPLVLAVIIDKVGRRPPGIAMAAASVAMLLTLIGLSQPGTFVVVTLVTIGWTAASACTTLLWPYTAEVFPTDIRSTGLGFTSALARVASMLTPLVVGGVLAMTGSVKLVFGLLAVSSFSVLLIWLLAAKETARRSLEEISSKT